MSPIKKVLVQGANGQIARWVIRILVGRDGIALTLPPTFTNVARGKRPESQRTLMAFRDDTAPKGSRENPH
ncbi:hypothetical protein OL229_07485 [Neisseriaceae bacterium JH1-16]|nr:hypothetical protein [Neisseriaceae bacterium JH1-16]